MNDAAKGSLAVAGETPPDYEHDVFVSYRRTHPYNVWLKEIFLPEFTASLNQMLPSDARIFRDVDAINPGDAWPDALRRGVRGSRCLVALWAPEYFRSPWCLSEWKSFQKRGPNFVLPMRWTKTLKHFPPEACEIQMASFDEFAYHGKGFLNSDKFMEFQEAVRGFAEVVAAAIENAPPYNPHDPRFEPEVVAAPPARPKILLSPLGGGGGGPNGAVAA